MIFSFPIFTKAYGTPRLHSGRDIPISMKKAENTGRHFLPLILFCKGLRSGVNFEGKGVRRRTTEENGYFIWKGMKMDTDGPTSSKNLFPTPWEHSENDNLNLRKEREGASRKALLQTLIRAPRLGRPIYFLEMKQM